MKKNWKALAAIAAVLIIVAIAVVLINLRPGAQAAQPEPSADNGMVAGKFGFPVSKINIGEGGTKTAADGKTPTGYNGTCDSAVQAAANYTPTLVDVHLETWGTQKATLNSLAVPGPWLETVLLPGTIISDAKAQGTALKTFGGGWMDQADVKAGGLYRTVSCEPKKTALVQVFFGALGTSDTLPEAYFGTRTMELTWKGDWKISNVVTGVNDADLVSQLKDKGPSGGVGGTTTGKIPPLDEPLVARYFEDLSKEGWVEYANATR
ncbi:hypothetical protein [Arthrobacter sp. Soil762]|uniref:hypothetical protein n=1 Tax=Arthrobacter sp. Soil762 TaxID=1736401 RepID=UPI0006FB8CB2|nr:hypothetical protein [Arthrobacter sp. Soil762]KRE76261.1 hypothetical protein ASG77_19940 [Arthrobacter sp. Soil762]